MAKDYYSILGLKRDATKDEVKKAFRKLAHKLHPDKKDGDEAKFKEINEAYRVLSDEKKRSEYDAYGQVFSDGSGGPQGGMGGFDFSGFANNFSGFQGGQGGVEFDLGDIFGDFFGGGSRTRRGRDISIDLEISFEEAVFGIERKVLLTKASQCNECGGIGAQKGSAMKKCGICNGTRKIHDTRSSFFGTFTSVRTCTTCRGTGEVPEKLCNICKGVGVTKQQEEISIAIPRGINDGEIVRLSGAGEAVPRGASGDLYIKVRVRPHHVFIREGSNLIMTLDVKVSDALLGAEYSILTIDKKDLKVKIPKGVSFGETLRLRENGISVDGKRKGDLLIKLNVKIPSKLSSRAEKLVKELKEEGI